MYHFDLMNHFTVPNQIYSTSTVQVRLLFSGLNQQYLNITFDGVERNGNKIYK